MTQVEILDAARDFSGGYKVDASRGGRNVRVSSEWEVAGAMIIPVQGRSKPFRSTSGTIKRSRNYPAATSF